MFVNNDYLGKWANDNMEGEGVYVYKNGTVVEGDGKTMFSEMYDNLY